MIPPELRARPACYRHGVRRLVLASLVGLVLVSPPASGAVRDAVLHEPIPADPREDLAMRVTLDGDLPAALQTPSGIVSAPDPRAPTSASDAAYGSRADTGTFQPDRDTQRPQVSSYDDPFTPSTAPFKRLEAFDAVREDYTLYVRDTRLAQVPLGAPPAADDEAFYADIVVDAAPNVNVRIPTVGPGARVVRARMGVGPEDVAFQVTRDAADQWYVKVTGTKATVRARLVMELAISRAVFGGQMGNPSWAELPSVPPPPDNVARDAAKVAAVIGVSRQMRPRDAVAKLVSYFRSFVDSDEAPTGQGNVYLDLALSRKGVCRHRAFAFLVTALSLGIPARMVLNEAHAWVEVHDGTLWRRIDLGGAGRMQPPNADGQERAVYRPPPDAFGWPQNAGRGDDMVADARAAAQSSNGPGGAGAGSNASFGDGGVDHGPSSSPAAASNGAGTTGNDDDDRAPPILTLVVDEVDPHRGLPLRVHGMVRAEGEACAHVAVEILLRDVKSKRTFTLGTLATGDDGTFSGGIVVPGSTPLADYDVIARTPGDARCGGGGSN
jgi:transglutaminase-like putative cysteine protease